MGLRLILLGVLVAGCVAPVGAATGDCRMTAAFIQAPTGRQIEVIGSQFTANEPITLNGSTPHDTIDVPITANDQGNFDVQIAAKDDGQYIVGPATGQVCTAPIVTLIAVTPRPTPTVPPLPVITLPPTDTE